MSTTSASATAPHLFLTLLHYPMLDRQGREVTTAVTNLDIHDLARSCKTYGVHRYFIANPEDEQLKLVDGILTHWREGVNQAYHPKRAQALELVHLVHTLEEAVNEATRLAGGLRPLLAMPDARPVESVTERGSPSPEALPYGALRARWDAGEVPALMVVLGTGWGISPRYFKHMDVVLAPLKGPTPYNHLSVRAAGAIVLDRLFGAH